MICVPEGRSFPSSRPSHSLGSDVPWCPRSGEQKEVPGKVQLTSGMLAGRHSCWGLLSSKMPVSPIAALFWREGEGGGEMSWVIFRVIE